MDICGETIAQIRDLCSAVTEDTCDSVIRQGRELLCRLRELGTEKEEAYRLLLQYHRNMEDSLSRDCMEDIMDYVTGWCAPQMRIWQD